MFNVVDMNNDLFYNPGSGLVKRILMTRKKHITDAIRKPSRMLAAIAQVGDVLMQYGVALFC